MGVLMEAMAWTTGKFYKVEEVACIANGASNCVYRIPKQPSEEESGMWGAVSSSTVLRK
jgi:hypothetical protein